MKTCLWSIGFVLGMMCTIPILCIYYIVKMLFGVIRADKFAYYFTRFWAKSIIITTGSSVIVKGLDALTNKNNVCFICNHQSLFDIPVLMGWLTIPVGFVAKQELKKIPVLSTWITAIHSVFLDRSNSRNAINSINKAAETIRNGHAIVIFPEGTRSQTGQIGDFKLGSLRLAINANAVIQPIALIGTRNIFEINKRINRSEIVLQILKPIKPSDEIYQDKQLMVNQIHSDIVNAYNNVDIGMK